MWSAIGSTLSEAVGIMLSPMPIAGLIVLLSAKDGRAKGAAFVAGWVIALGLVVTLLAVAFGSVDDSTSSTPSTWVGVVEVVLGAALLYIAFNSWRGRPRDGEEPVEPGWMQAIDKMSTLGALGVGFGFIALNTKNIPLSIAAAAEWTSEGVSGGDLAVAIVVFTLTGSSALIAALALTLVAPATSSTVLDDVRHWLMAHNAVIMTVLFLLLGSKILGAGISALG